MEVARHVQSTKNRKLVIFLQYIKKTVAIVFALYCDAKHSDILRGSGHVRCYLFLGSNTGYSIGVLFLGGGLSKSVARAFFGGFWQAKDVFFEILRFYAFPDTLSL